MALRVSRRSWVAGAGTSLLSLACSRPSATSTVAPTEHTFISGKPDPTKETVLVASPFLQSTHALWSSLRTELTEEFNVEILEVTSATSPRILELAVKTKHASCVVVMGDEALRLVEKLQQGGAVTPPSLVLMTSFAESAVGRLNNCTGISYEVPGLTSFVTLRQLTERPVKRIGVLYRPELKDFIEAQSRLAKMEKIEIVGQLIEGDPAPRNVRYALRTLLRDRDIDALWVLNDSTLLAPDTIRKAWLPESRSRPVPIVVGVSSLVNSSLQFGNVAVVPDHGAMGVQAANLLFDIADNDWQVAENRVEVPISVETIVDMSRADELRLVSNARDLIDREVY